MKIYKQTCVPSFYKLYLSIMFEAYQMDRGTFFVARWRRGRIKRRRTRRKGSADVIKAPLFVIISCNILSVSYLLIKFACQSPTCGPWFETNPHLEAWRGISLRSDYIFILYDHFICCIITFRLDIAVDKTHMPALQFVFAHSTRSTRGT